MEVRKKERKSLGMEVTNGLLLSEERKNQLKEKSRSVMMYMKNTSVMLFIRLSCLVSSSPKTAHSESE